MGFAVARAIVVSASPGATGRTRGRSGRFVFFSARLVFLVSVIRGSIILNLYERGPIGLSVRTGPVFFIKSSGYKDEDFGMVFWQLEEEMIDFTGDEFEALIVYLRTGRLFEYLQRHRPALRDQLLGMFQATLEEMELEENDVEHALESRLLDLHRRI